MDFRATIIAAMKDQGWSAYKLGHESGVPARTVQKFVRGDADIGSERLAKLCRTLGLELRPTRRSRRKGR